MRLFRVMTGRFEGFFGKYRGRSGELYLLDLDLDRNGTYSHWCWFAESDIEEVQLD